jgi:hypothetical protein
MPDEGGRIDSLKVSTLMKRTKFAVSYIVAGDEFNSSSLLKFLPSGAEEINIIVNTRINAILNSLFINKIYSFVLPVAVI